MHLQSYNTYNKENEIAVSWISKILKGVRETMKYQKIVLSFGREIKAITRKYNKGGYPQLLLKVLFEISLRLFI